MKKIFILCASLAFFTACNNDSKISADATKVIPMDTSAQYKNSAITDTAKTAAVTKDAPAKTEVKKEKESTIYRAPKENSKPAQVINQTPVEKPSSTDVNNNNPIKTETNTNTNNAVNTSAPADNKTNTANTVTTVKPENKGMNNTTKDAIIGGAAGAVGGAIFSKSKGAGAVIGGLLGAGAGYLFGRKKDHKKEAIK